MKKLLPFLLGLALSLTACDKENCNPARNAARFEENKAIAVNYNEGAQQEYYHVVDGENIVFRYNHTAAECENVMDNEWGYTLTFEVDKTRQLFGLQVLNFHLPKGFTENLVRG